MSDWDEARQEAMDEAISERAAEYEEQGKQAGKNEMRDDILRIIDLKISELSREQGTQLELAGYDLQVSILQSIYDKIEKL
jgi:hypothetical protein